MRKHNNKVTVGKKNMEFKKRLVYYDQKNPDRINFHS